MKQLYKSTTNKKVAGVCGGIGEYFDIDLYELGAEPTVVSDVVLASIDVTGQTTDFTVGDTFTFDGVVTATYSDGSTKNVTSSAEITPPDLTTAGTKNVTVSYTEKEVTKTKVYQVTVSSGSSSGDKVIIIDGSKLTSDATTADTDKTYEELSANLWEDSNAWYTAVRVVEKTFDDETFKITEREIKITELSSKNYRYVGVREVIR